MIVVSVVRRMAQNQQYVQNCDSQNDSHLHSLNRRCYEGTICGTAS